MEITIKRLTLEVKKASLEELKKYFHTYDNTGRIGKERIAKLEADIAELSKE
jgi:hypothetical protein